VLKQVIFRRERRPRR